MKRVKLLALYYVMIPLLIACGSVVAVTVYMEALKDFDVAIFNGWNEKGLGIDYIIDRKSAICYSHVDRYSQSHIVTVPCDNLKHSPTIKAFLDTGARPEVKKK